jgi:putative transposase
MHLQSPPFKRWANGFFIYIFVKILFMAHSLSKIWIHAIWTTKERLPLIKTDVEKELHREMKNAFKEKECHIKIINGMEDHVHCLFILNKKISLADVIKHVKGGSSHHVNLHDLINDKFAWQTGYAAYSVSESIVDSVYEYIKNQKKHHVGRTFEDEFLEFCKIFGFSEKGEELWNFDDE